MTNEKTEPETNDLSSYGAGLVSYQIKLSVLNCAFFAGADLTFDHVLYVQATEVARPGDVAEFIFREYLAARFVAYGYGYQTLGPIWWHICQEWQRLCAPDGSPEKLWLINFKLDCYRHDASLASGWYYGLETGRTTQCQTADYHDPFSDGSDDEDEEDTLNSELLLPQEHCALDGGEFRQNANYTDTLEPRRRVNMFSPIERKD